MSTNDIRISKLTVIRLYLCLVLLTDQDFFTVGQDTEPDTNPGGF